MSCLSPSGDNKLVFWCLPAVRVKRAAGVEKPAKNPQAINDKSPAKERFSPGFPRGLRACFTIDLYDERVTIR